MSTQTLILIGMFLAVICYILTLYHMAHGNESKAVAQGAEIVLMALARDGRILPDGQESTSERSLNLGEEDFSRPEEEREISGVILARSEKHAEQIGDRINSDLMKEMNKVI
jgi:hypothetical protein